MLRHQRAGASTLAALAVPEERLQRVAERISQYAEVNHNYQREHRYNLWFVLTAGDRAQLDRVLAEIAADTGLQPLDLPMQEAYCIDLAFPWRPADEPRRTPRRAARTCATCWNRACRWPAGPYRVLAERIGAGERSAGTGPPLGRRRPVPPLRVILHHRALGYTANAMLVLDVADAEVDAVGRALAHETIVSLCYRRPRRLPMWPYNLFCMIHGRERAKWNARSRPCWSATPCARHRTAGCSACAPGSAAAATPRRRPTWSAAMDEFDRRLLNRLQHGLPLEPHPYALLAAELDCREEDILRRLDDLLDDGTLTRFGPLFDIEPLGGAFTLAAMSVPEARFEEIAALLAGWPQVAHNYRREHALNMWLVVACDSPAEVAETLARLERELAVLDLPRRRPTMSACISPLTPCSPAA